MQNRSVEAPQAAAKPVRVAFDVSALTGQPTGVGFHALNLALALRQWCRSVECILLSNRHLKDFPELCAFKNTEGLRFPIRALWMQLLWPRLAARINPDLCHFTNSLGCLWNPTPYVVTIHDMSLSRFPGFHVFPKRYYSRILIPRVARRASHVVTISEFSRSEIHRILGIPKKRISAIPLAVEPEFRPVTGGDAWRRVKESYQLTYPYLIFVGTLEPRKNLVRLLQAFARLVSSENRGYQLLLVGRVGWKTRDLWAAIERLNIGSRVRHLGYVERHDLPALIGGADAAVYPSILEGFGLPVLEAMACGTAVLTSRGSSLEEVAGECALYVDPWNVDSIFEGLRALVRDDDLRKELAGRGLQRAMEFSWAETARKTAEIYAKVAGGLDNYRPVRHFELVVQLDTPEKLTLPNRLGRAFTSAEFAILKTVVYGALFDYPLTCEEITRRLFDVSLTRHEVEECLMTSALLRRHIERSGDLYHLKGLGGHVTLRMQRERATERQLSRLRWGTRTVCRFPWIRMVALSGASAHRNMRERDDVDLFLIADERRLWLCFFLATVFSKITGIRKELCINYVIGRRSLELHHRDFFSADQLLSLHPLWGAEYLPAVLRANPWVYKHFPNQRAHLPHVGELPDRRDDGGVLSSVLDAADALVMHLYGRYLHRKARSGEADIRLSRQMIKVHLRSHKGEVSSRFLQDLRDREAG